MLIAWRDWTARADSTIAISGIGTNLTSVENLKDRRLAAKFVRNGGLGGVVVVEVTFAVDRPVQLVSLLGHNIPSGGFTSVTLKNAADSTVAFLPGALTWQPPIDSGIQRNWFARFPQQYTCRKVEIGISTNDVFPVAPLDIGRLWTSQTWAPNLGLMFQGMSAGVVDPSRVVESQGGQIYVVDRARRRTLRMALTLPESEAIGTAADPDNNAQSLLFEAGNSGSVIVVPTTEGATAAEREHIIHRLGVYGILQRSSDLELLDRGNADGSKVQRLYRLSLDVLEQL